MTGDRITPHELQQTLAELSHRKAEEVVKRQAELINLSPDAMFVRRLDGVITFWSTGAENLYGFTKQEAIGKTSRDLLGTTLPEPFDSILATLREGRRWTGELIHRRRDGVLITVQSRWLLRPGSGEYDEEIFESNVDITERKRAEEVVQRQADLIELSPDAMFVRTLGGHITFWSKGAEKLYGYTKEEALGKTSQELLVTTLPEPFESIVAKLRKGGEWSGELIHCRRGGALLTVQSRWLLRPGSGEYPEEIFESNVDITLRKRMEEELRQSEERFRMLIETSSEPVAILDDARRFASISQAGAQVLGWSRGVLAGKESGALIPSDERPMFEKAINELQDSAERNLAILMTRFTRENGNRRWIEWEFSRIRAGGQARGFIVRLRDLGAYLPVGRRFHKGHSDK